MFLYLATYGELPGFGKVDLAMYVSDSIENGVKNMRKNLEFRWENSEFLQQYVPDAKFTDIRWEFTNKDGKRLIIKGYGALTGVRGSKEMGKRPNFALLDDLVSDEGARSPTITASIEDTVYKAIDYALHPTRRKIIWNGTPFNSNDPLYKAAESGAWYVNVFPVCNTFPCAPEEFRGAWEDRFTYQYVKDQYDKAVLAGKVDSFMQELMLRIISDDDRLVFDHDLVWYDSKKVQQHKERFNFYITTDFATSESKASDFSVISVWAYNNNGDWLLVDGICKRQLMDKNIDDLFRLVQMYRPQQVGIEVSGQQGGFISWIYDQMVTRNIYFTIASENNNGKAGIRPATNKMERFNVVLPLFKTKKIWLPEDQRDHPLVVELLQELRYASPKGFKSKHDDAIDTVSMLAKLTPWKPTEETINTQTGDTMFDEEEDISSGAYSSYIV
jgi:predicted phage terminase large subunit-like protein